MAPSPQPTKALRQRARELGFSLVGVSPAQPLAAADFYARWVALGYAGEMAYLERAIDRRRDPAQLLAGARSIVCLGMHYARSLSGLPSEPLSGPPRATHSAAAPMTDASPVPDAPPPRGRIAGFALGHDYHDLVKDRVSQLWDFLVQQIDTEARGRWFVDTAPVLERELAHRAGLGWWGKNTCLINKRQGSTFFLAELFTTAELSLDEPAVDHCGTCTRCLDACPTNAFPAPYVLDSRRCISYLTIEQRGPIPRALRARMGAWIFGCDVCQDVCPWNRHAPQPSVADLSARPDLATPDLLDLIQMDDTAFAERFRHHGAKRPKRRGLLRNVAVALGNVGGATTVPVLTRVLAQESEPLVRAHVAWALGHIGGEAARSALRTAQVGESDTQVREEIDEALRACENQAR